MIEIIEELEDSRNLLELALDRYLNACSAIQNYCTRGTAFGDALANVMRCAENELPLFTSRQKRLKRAKAAMGCARNQSPTSVPVNTLPPEILSRIFGLLLRAQIRESEDHDYSQNFKLPKYPELLSHVCSHWRRVAIGTQALWSYISFAPRHRAWPGNKRLLARAQAHATRSGKLPVQIDIFDSPSTRSRPDKGEESFAKFLASMAVRMRVLHISVSPGDSFLRFILRSCFSSAGSGIFTRFILWPRCLNPPSKFIESGETPKHSGSILLGLSEQTLEDFLLPVTDLRLCGRFFDWSSKAYHGLVELHLSRPSGGRDTALITESQVMGILASSPGLRVVHFDLNITESHPAEDIRAAPVHLEELEILNLGSMSTDHLRFLQLLTPGSRMSRLALELPSKPSDVVSSLSFDCAWDFNPRWRAPNLCVHAFNSTGGQLCYVHQLFELALHIHILILQDFLNTDRNPTFPSPNNDVLAIRPSTDHLYLIRCFIPLAHLRWMFKAYTIRKLTAWESLFLSEKGESQEQVHEIVARDYPVVNILPKGSPNPVADWVSSFDSVVL